MPLARKPRSGARSSLLSHTFPLFYACYLLKSVKTSTSKATYIGSTPDPPRRIRKVPPPPKPLSHNSHSDYRQHNGELTQGAFKTRNKRPWVMQLIVYGFPSKLFEWAWQHPHVSRHIRDSAGNRIFNSSGRILRYMITNHPYNTWPLQLKIFTPEALKCWEDLSKGKAAANTTPPLPRGFSVDTELEGVDGKSGMVGSGRKKPIEVKDEEFTSSHIKKNLELIASGSTPVCAICKDKLTGYATVPLLHALCPQASCSSVSHLSCLSRKFLAEASSRKSSKVSPMIPRGGECPGCSSYILWGHVVKGMYRRAAGGASTMEDDIAEEVENGEMFVSDTDEDVTSPSPPLKKATRISRSKKGKRKESSSEGEAFDFSAADAYVSSEDEGTFLPRGTAIPLSPKKRPRPKASKDSANDAGQSKASSSADTPKRKKGKTTIASSSPGTPTRRGRPRKVPLASPRRGIDTISPLKGQVLEDPPAVRSFYDSESSHDEVTDVDIATSPGALARSMSNLTVSSPSSAVIELSD
ncbi:Slx4p interacting protein [Marasmius tenuissimus]|uniref:Slx4p interacting protein n=1 Tax=Marasmius tenuissimus TaxID=585030 RepID=A0ABR3AGU2_9AGAR